MKLAIMQPYLFPYLGYFQLIHAVDEFVIYDDVSYIKRGWINRNNILNQGRSQLITLEVSGGSQNRLVNQVKVGANRKSLLENIRHSYVRAPQFRDVFPLIEKILLQNESNLALFLARGLFSVCDYLGLHPVWHMSSDIEKDTSLRGQDKIVSICESLDASHYINLPGGRNLYDAEMFYEKGIRLSFIDSLPVIYPQFGGDSVPGLSIIDVMMFNDREQCRRLLLEYRLG
jgi:WbqC-like protein family